MAYRCPPPPDFSVKPKVSGARPPEPRLYAREVKSEVKPSETRSLEARIPIPPKDSVEPQVSEVKLEVPKPDYSKLKRLEIHIKLLDRFKKLCMEIDLADALIPGAVFSILDEYELLLFEHSEDSNVIKFVTEKALHLLDVSLWDISRGTPNEFISYDLDRLSRILRRVTFAFEQLNSSRYHNLKPIVYKGFVKKISINYWSCLLSCVYTTGVYNSEVAALTAYISDALSDFSIEENAGLFKSCLENSANAVIISYKLLAFSTLMENSPENTIVAYVISLLSFRYTSEDVEIAIHNREMIMNLLSRLSYENLKYVLTYPGVNPELGSRFAYFFGYDIELFTPKVCVLNYFQGDVFAYLIDRFKEIYDCKEIVDNFLGSLELLLSKDHENVAGVILEKLPVLLNYSLSTIPNEVAESSNLYHLITFILANFFSGQHLNVEQIIIREFIQIILLYHWVCLIGKEFKDMAYVISNILVSLDSQFCIKFFSGLLYNLRLDVEFESKVLALHNLIESSPEKMQVAYTISTIIGLSQQTFSELTRQTLCNTKEIMKLLSLFPDDNIIYIFTYRLVNPELALKLMDLLELLGRPLLRYDEIERNLLDRLDTERRVSRYDIGADRILNYFSGDAFDHIEETFEELYRSRDQHKYPGFKLISVYLTRLESLASECCKVEDERHVAELILKKLMILFISLFSYEFNGFSYVSNESDELRNVHRNIIFILANFFNDRFPTLRLIVYPEFLRTIYLFYPNCLACGKYADVVRATSDVLESLGLDSCVKFYLNLLIDLRSQIPLNDESKLKLSALSNLTSTKFAPRGVQIAHAISTLIASQYFSELIQQTLRNTKKNTKKIMKLLSQFSDAEKIHILTYRSTVLIRVNPDLAFEYASILKYKKKLSESAFLELKSKLLRNIATEISKIPEASAVPTIPEARSEASAVSAIPEVSLMLERSEAKVSDYDEIKAGVLSYFQVEIFDDLINEFKRMPKYSSSFAGEKLSDIDILFSELESPLYEFLMERDERDSLDIVGPKFAFRFIDFVELFIGLSPSIHNRLEIKLFAAYLGPESKFSKYDIQVGRISSYFTKNTFYYLIEIFKVLCNYSDPREYPNFTHIIASLTTLESLAFECCKVEEDNGNVARLIRDRLSFLFTVPLTDERSEPNELLNFQGYFEFILANFFNDEFPTFRATVYPEFLKQIHLFFPDCLAGVGREVVARANSDLLSNFGTDFIVKFHLDILFNLQLEVLIEPKLNPILYATSVINPNFDIKSELKLSALFNLMEFSSKKVKIALAISILIATSRPDISKLTRKILCSEEAISNILSKFDSDDIFRILSFDIYYTGAVSQKSILKFLPTIDEKSVKLLKPATRIVSYFKSEKFSALMDKFKEASKHSSLIDGVGREFKSLFLSELEPLLSEYIKSEGEENLIEVVRIESLFLLNNLFLNMPVISDKSSASRTRKYIQILLAKLNNEEFPNLRLVFCQALLEYIWLFNPGCLEHARKYEAIACSISDILSNCNLESNVRLILGLLNSFKSDAESESKLSELFNLMQFLSIKMQMACVISIIIGLSGQITTRVEEYMVSFLSKFSTVDLMRIFNFTIDESTVAVANSRLALKFMSSAEVFSADERILFKKVQLAALSHPELSFMTQNSSENGPMKEYYNDSEFLNYVHKLNEWTLSQNARFHKDQGLVHIILSESLTKMESILQDFFQKKEINFKFTLDFARKCLLFLLHIPLDPNSDYTDYIILDILSSELKRHPKINKVIYSEFLISIIIIYPGFFLRKEHMYSGKVANILNNCGETFFAKHFVPTIYQNYPEPTKFRSSFLLLSYSIPIFNRGTIRIIPHLSKEIQMIFTATLINLYAIEIYENRETFPERKERNTNVNTLPIINLIHSFQDDTDKSRALTYDALLKYRDQSKQKYVDEEYLRLVLKFAYCFTIESVRLEVEKWVRVKKGINTYEWNQLKERARKKVQRTEDQFDFCPLF
ncbi:MAG: hypothetical protein LBJ93_02440 [Clostridiales bacterium]|nr:hypothetical protein [Clostridiales bacterium]